MNRQFCRGDVKEKEYKSGWHEVILLLSEARNIFKEICHSYCMYHLKRFLKALF